MRIRVYLEKFNPLLLSASTREVFFFLNKRYDSLFSFFQIRDYSRLFQDKYYTVSSSIKIFIKFSALNLCYFLVLKRKVSRISFEIVARETLGGLVAILLKKRKNALPDGATKQFDFDRGKKGEITRFHT